MGIKLKHGMKGSNGGRARCEKTAELKNKSKGLRRLADRAEIQENLKELGSDRPAKPAKK